MKIELSPIAYVRNERLEIEDDNWGAVVSEIELLPGFSSEAFEGIEEFSHLEIIFYMDKVKDENAVVQCRHPRNNTALPKVGTYAQRNKNRPNKLGLTVVELIERKGAILKVRNLDAINGTPVLDVKPVMSEYLPKGTVRQPGWTRKIMKHYWG